MIFITWTGLGWLFFLMPSIILIVEALIFTIFGIDMKTYMAHYLAIGFVLSSILCWFFGKKVNKEKVITYTENGNTKTRTIKNEHKLWGMPVQYFSIVLIILAIICFIKIIFS